MMSAPIAIFFHFLMRLGDPPKVLPGANYIVLEQLTQMRQSGVVAVASQLFVFVNDTEDMLAQVCKIVPDKSNVTFHGLNSRSECLTILALENWVKTHPGWYVLYLHSKGSSSPHGSQKFHANAQWRHTMMNDLVANWRLCVAELDKGFDIVCSHWKWNQCDGTQHIPAGNFLWVTSDFVAKLPSIMLRERIKMSGIGALESRYEAETFWGNGPKPNVRQFRPHGGDGIP